MSEQSLNIGADGQARCWWCGDDAEYMRYHDAEWGRPVSNDVRLFEKMSLEGFQAGLSWITILRKRENFRAAFDGFDFYKIAKYGADDVERLVADAGIIRHRGKIEAAINNAQRVIELIEEQGSLAKYLWSFEPQGRVVLKSRVDIQGEVAESKALSKDLKKRGFKFVGPTTMYALMQAMGMVNDHIEGCTHFKEIENARAKFKRP
jgi:DNA-3-methyladenine glycosylase I